MANVSIVGEIVQTSANHAAQGYSILRFILIGGDFPDVGE